MHDPVTRVDGDGSQQGGSPDLYDFDFAETSFVDGAVFQVAKHADDGKGAIAALLTPQ